MPRAAHRVVDHQSLAERPAVMGAVGADREDFLATTGQQHGLVADPADQHGAVGEIGLRDAVGQIRPVSMFVGHLLLLAATRPVPSPLRCPQQSV